MVNSIWLYFPSLELLHILSDWAMAFANWQGVLSFGLSFARVSLPGLYVSFDLVSVGIFRPSPFPLVYLRFGSLI